MSTQVYLGAPPDGVKQWIKGRGGRPESWFVFADGTEFFGVLRFREGCEGTFDLRTAADYGWSPPGHDGIEGPPEWYEGKKPVKAVLGTNVTSIGNFAFYNCGGLADVTIPDSVTSIRGYAFSDCGDFLFDTATIPGVKLVDGWAVGYADSLPGALNLSGARGIGDEAFSWCTGLASVTIGGGVKTIGEIAFCGCDGLTSVTIEDGVESVGIGAFLNCGGLTGVTIPDSVMEIGQDAFSSCSGLASVTIGNGVENIGGSAFYDCARLKDVTFPGRDKATVRGMSGYRWSLARDCVIHCSDGDVDGQ